jgi:uncharacterized protein
VDLLGGQAGQHPALIRPWLAVCTRDIAGAGAEPAYQIFTTGDAGGLHGGLFATRGKMPGYAVFTVLVKDVGAACQRAEEAGGQVQRAPEVNPAGVTFAHLLDPAGNHFAVFKPPFTQP